MRVKNDGDRIHVVIADNGTGMEASIRKNIFKAHSTSKVHGTGFGLWLSQGIAKKHGGVITCRTSTVAGKNGTTFRLSLPASRRGVVN